ncbi:DUF402 domain-containing protein [Nocardioides cheoyonin]|uniref:DUF402 domain-containing protein n=1 Tax=Nocardioides cheoyonin TaxID=3156615 RepID=UPI0032B59AF6
MERFEPGHPVTVEMTKWGGRPHWRFHGVYLGADEHGEWIGYPPGSRYSRPGRAIEADWAAVGIVPHHDAAHLPTFNRPNSTVSSEIYVDMTTPPVWDDDVVSSIDLDLDVVRRFDGTIAIVDQDEFEAHQLEYGYPPEIITMAEESAERVYAAVSSGAPPYDGSAERWFAALEELATT